jgi:hypothetical protein
MRQRPLSLILVISMTAIAMLWTGIRIVASHRRSRDPSSPFARTPEGLRPTKSDELLHLSDDARAFIWKTEDVAFQISHKAGPLIADALAQANKTALLEFLASDFEGHVLAPDSSEHVDCSCADFHFQRAGEHEILAANADQFTDWLLEKTRMFRPTPRVQLALLYLSPVDRDHMESSWEGTWILRCRGKTQSSGVGEVVIRGRFGCTRLPDDYLHERGWIHSWRIDQATEASAERFLMEETSAQSGIDVGSLHDNWNTSRGRFVVTPGGVYACDYNQDGLVDLLITDRGPAKLYAGRGSARFEEVTFQAELVYERPIAGIAAFADLDNDGDEDLILGSLILENDSGHFVRRGYLPLGQEASAISIADYDRDGYVDLYVSYVAPEPNRTAGKTSWVDDHSGIPNKLWQNRGHFRFEDVTNFARAGAGNRSTFTSLWLDADEDGWPDLYVINELGSNLLLRNEHNGSFSEHSVGPSFDGFTMGAAAGDVDGDGHTDLYLANMFSKAGQRIIANLHPDAYPPVLMHKIRGFVAGNLLLYNRGHLQFDDSRNSGIADVGWAYGPALIDLDNDGLLDIHSTCGFASFSRDEPDG